MTQKNDDTFKMYQELRAKAEKDARVAVFEWALSDGPDNMTVEQVKVVAQIAVYSVNHHTRQVYDMMHAAARSGGET